MSLLKYVKNLDIKLNCWMFAELLQDNSSLT